MKESGSELEVKKMFSETNPDKIFERNSSFYLKIIHNGKSSISIFKGFGASIDKIFILEERLGTKL